MRIHTVQIAKWRLAKAQGITFVDTTVKTGTSIYAPSWEIVRAIKGGVITEEEYTAQYKRMMARSYHMHRDEWMASLRDDTLVAYACFCPPGVFCHRLLLARFFERLCEQHEIPFENLGELK